MVMNIAAIDLVVWKGVNAAAFIFVVISDAPNLSECFLGIETFPCGSISGSGLEYVTP